MAPAPHGGRIGENIMYFGRVLRAAGLPIGPGAVLEALEAVGKVGLASRNDLYWTLHAVFITRHEQVEIFDQAFHIFWRNPKFLERMTAILLPQLLVDGHDTPTEHWPRLDRFREHDIDLPVGAVSVSVRTQAQLRGLLDRALELGKGLLKVKL
ncbi:MAG: hypothetical protein ACC634_06450, partial [Hyphomicrobiales bacterium]